MHRLLTKNIAFYSSILLLLLFSACSKDPADRLAKIEAKMEMKEIELKNLIASVGCQELDSYKIWPDTSSINMYSNCATTEFYAVHESIESRFLQLKKEQQDLNNSYWDIWSAQDNRQNTQPCSETVWVNPLPIGKVCEDGTVRHRSIEDLDQATLEDGLRKLEVKLADYEKQLACDGNGEWKITPSMNRAGERIAIAYDAKAKDYEAVRKMIGNYNSYLFAWITLEKPNLEPHLSWNNKYEVNCTNGKPVIIKSEAK